MTQKKRLGENQAFISIVASLLSIVIGLLFGFILLLLLNAKNAPAGMWNMLSNGITDFGNVLYRSTPLIMTGLSVAIAFKVACLTSALPASTPSVPWPPCSSHSLSRPRGMSAF